MFSNRASISSALNNFKIENHMLCYNNFMPRLYNWCVSLGFQPGKIIPSRAFCSDESQGFPIILMAKHFGAFPFNHGRVGGIVSVDRHGPFAEHGQDMMLIQASHVGYDPESGQFGTYRRLHTEHEEHTCDCGKIGLLVEQYASEYRYACDNIRLLRHDGRPALLIDNCLLGRTRTEGLFLIADNLVQGAVNRILPKPLAARSTGSVYPVSDALLARLGDAAWPAQGSTAIGALLAPEDFYFRRDWDEFDTVQNQLEFNLIPAMPWIVTDKHPLLMAARANTLAEFDRTYRSLVQSPAMRKRNLLFVAGLNIDISPTSGVDFPLTKFVPWAAYVQQAKAAGQVLEQDDVLQQLAAQSNINSAQLDLERSIQTMNTLREVEVRL